jgi:DNA invertase Pin-like site-specific DNA recombinase
LFLCILFSIAVNADPHPLPRLVCKQLRNLFICEGVHHNVYIAPSLAEHTLIVWKLDRLGRSLRDLIAMLDDLRERGVKFRSLTEQIDTETPTGRAMWQMIGVLAELERSLISERTRAGVKAAQRRGVKFGRKPKLTPQQIAHARKLIDQGEDRQKVATLFKVGRKTLYRALAL